MVSLFELLSHLFFAFLRIQPHGSFPPPLSAKEEQEAFLLCRQGDEKAREKLIMHNLRLVAHIVKKYMNCGIPMDDLMSLGTVGLIKAIDSFDPEKGIRFATYAGKCLSNEVLMSIRAGKKHLGEVSLSDQIDTDRDGDPMTYSDVIAVEDTISEDVLLKIRSKELSDGIREVLDERERQILLLRYGLGRSEAKTQREIAGMLGISRSYVSRIEKSALEKLRKRIR